MMHQLGALTISRIDLWAVRLPLHEPFVVSYVSQADVPTIIVRLQTTDGIIGWGEAASAPTMTGETLGSMVAAVRSLADKLEGMPADGIAAAMPVFRRQGNGHFVTTVSTAGLKIVPNMAVYAATKNAVRTVMESLRQESTDASSGPPRYRRAAVARRVPQRLQRRRRACEPRPLAARPRGEQDL